MTKEKIEELRVYAERFVIGGTDRLGRSVLRLLEERKRLLEALKREYDSDTGLSQESLAAIAFAEEAAR